MGIFESLDAAWEDSNIWSTWKALRADLEFDKRFKDMSFKINIIRENSKFFLEILNNKQSTASERTIIVLLAVEVLFGIAKLVMHT